MNTNEDRKKESLEILQALMKEVNCVKVPKDWMNIEIYLRRFAVLTLNFAMEHSKFNSKRSVNVLNKRVQEIKEFENDFYINPTKEKKYGVERKIKVVEKYVNACKLINQFEFNEDYHLKIQNIIEDTSIYLRELISKVNHMMSLLEIVSLEISDNYSFYRM